MALIDFSLSNATLFLSSMGSHLGWKNLAKKEKKTAIIFLDLSCMHASESHFKDNC